MGFIALDQLQTDRKFLTSLASLEEFTIELEGCRNELKYQEERAAASKGSKDEKRYILDAAQGMRERVDRVTFDIRLIITAALEQLETEQAMEKIGGMFSSLNPFR